MSKPSKYKYIISWSAVLIWMAFIFFLSHQPASASSELSSGIVNFVMGLISTIFSEADINLQFLHFFIRKSAHFFAYFILGVLVLYALSIGRVMTFRLVLFALIICMLYAISDEVHQLFIPGRSGEVRDVLIDSAGSTVGITLVALWKRITTTP